MNNIMYTLLFSTIFIGILKFVLDKFLNEMYNNKIKRKVMMLQCAEIYFRFVFIFINFFALSCIFGYLVNFDHNNWYSVFLVIILTLLIAYLCIGICSLVFEWDLLSLRFNHFNLIQFYDEPNIDKNKYFVLKSYDLETNKIVINNNFGKKLTENLEDISIRSNTKQYVIYGYGNLDTKNLSWDGKDSNSYTKKYFRYNASTLIPGSSSLIFFFLRQYLGGCLLFKDELTVFLSISILASYFLIIKSLSKYHYKKEIYILKQLMKLKILSIY
ncbi:hypothetical protein RW115_11880 [Macrococcus capreoli]